MCDIVALVPASSSKSVPGVLPRVIRTLATVTVWPMSTSSPVPVCRPPNSGVAYQSVSQPVLEPPRSTKPAAAGSSPFAPPGPTAAALTGVSTCTDTVALGLGLAEGLGEGLAEGVVATTVAGRLAAGVLE